MAIPELEIWNGDWGLPSVDLKCLRVMAFAKFSGAPLKLKKTNNPWLSPSGELPVFRQGNDKLTKFEDITSYFKTHNYNADFELDARQQSDICAYSHLLEEKLLPGLTYSWWIDSKNYIDFTRPWFAKALPFPLNYFVPGSEQRRARKYLLGKYGLDEEEERKLETLVFKRAQECLTLLENRLGNEEFFFGRSPSSLDAVVFAYLAPLLKAPFPNPTLQNHMKACDNLVRFVVRIIHRYFPSISEDVQHQKTVPDSQSSNAEDEFPHKRRNQILAGFSAVFAMLGYAFVSGIVQIDISDGDEHDEEDEDEEDNAPHFYGGNYK